MHRIESVLEKSKSFYDNGDAAHDFAHIQRVMENCRWIGQTVGVNLKTLLPAAVLHDVVNLPKNHPDRLQASQMAAKKSEMILQESGYSVSEIEEIKNIITEHSYSLGKKPSSIESAVLQDADKMDALGAIGILRATTCGTKMGCAYYDPQDIFAGSRELNDKAYTVDHFFTKLLKLPDLMNTEAAKQEARERAQFMRLFLSRLSEEAGSAPENQKPIEVSNV